MARHLTRALLPTAATGLLLASVAGCAPAGDDAPPAAPPAAPAATGSSSPAPAPAERTAPRSFVVVGDSITAGTADVSRPMVGDRLQGDASWLPAALRESGWDLVAGWAVPGATTAQMLAGVAPADWTADVLVVMGGTNDLTRAVPWVESAAALQGIVAAVGAPTVVVVAIAPNDPEPAAREAYNAALADLAARSGWAYVDPWAQVDAGGAFAPGASADGTHPTAAAAADAGRRIGQALAALG